MNRSNQSLVDAANLSTTGAPGVATTPFSQAYVRFYDVAGYLIEDRKEWLKDGGGTFVAQTLTGRRTNAFGELVVQEDWDLGRSLDYESARATFAYDQSGALTKTTRSTDWDASVAGYRNEVRTEYDYDGAGRLESLNHQLRRRATGTAWPAAYTQLVGFEYYYDAAGRIGQAYTIWNNGLPAFPIAARPETIETFTYDGAGQLTGVDSNVAAGDAFYAYTPNGNRFSASESGGSHLYPSPGAQNRVTQDSTYTYVYDDEGNLVERRITSGNVLDQKYFWDHRNRLVRVEDFASGELAETIDYRYDAADGLVRRTATLAGGTPGVEYYVNESGRRAMTLDPDGDVLRRNQYGPTDKVLFDQVFDAAGNPTTQAEVDLRLPLGDHQNSTRAVLGNVPNGAVTVRQRVDYAPFGRIAATYDATGQPTTAALDTAFAHHGSLLDADTGLQLKGARWYSPDLSRFVSVDPVQDGANWYALDKCPRASLSPTRLAQKAA